MWPVRPRQAHKWQSAVQIVAGSPGMYGAPWLVARGAMRAGAGYALVGVPGAPPGGGLPPGEYVTHRLPAEGWEAEVAAGLDRVKALVIGPGLGAEVAGGVGRRVRGRPTSRHVVGPGGGGCRRPAGPRRSRHGGRRRQRLGGGRWCSPRTRASTPGWSDGPPPTTGSRTCASVAARTRCGRSPQRLTHRRRRARRKSPAGQRRVVPPGDGRNRRRAVRRHRRLPGQRPGRARGRRPGRPLPRAGRLDWDGRRVWWPATCLICCRPGCPRRSAGGSANGPATAR